MEVKRHNNSETEVKLSVIVSEDILGNIKNSVLKQVRKTIKITGFREGKAPLELVEKNVDPSMLQTQFLEEAINRLYVDAAKKEQLRPVGQPEISITKFVPFTTLEFEAIVQVIGTVKVGDYKKIKLAKTEVKVTEKDVNEVIQSLKTRVAEKKDVDRKAKNGDQVWIDFTGTDTQGTPIKGADGKDYPLLLDSNTFIPGFEENLIGANAGEEKSFTLTFPSDYGVKSLAGQNVKFTVTVTKVQEVIEPEVNDEFAAKVGPFKNLKQLKDDIKQQLKIERQNQSDREYESQLVEKITDKSSVALPQSLVEEQVERMLRDIQQNLVYRGQTIQEFYESEGKSEEDYRKEVLTPQAEKRVKAGLVLSEISELEGVDVTAEELDIRIQILKGQYKDEAMQTELDNPENRRDIASRILTEKTIQKLVDYATK
jgi:trigger factor